MFLPNVKTRLYKPKPTDKSDEDEVAATNRRRRCSFCERYRVRFITVYMLHHCIT